MTIDVDLDALMMTWSVAGALPQLPTGKHFRQDIIGQTADDLRKPGPLVVVPDSPAKVNIDPRR